MMNRLQRLDSESRTRASSRHNPIHIRRGAQHHRLSQPELQRRWLLLLTKVRMMMSYFDQRRRLIYILGLDATTLESSDAQGTYVLKSMMRGSVEEDPNHQEVAPAQRPSHARIIGQEVMGRFMDKTTQSKGTPVEDVETCPHPTTDLKRRACPGGKKTKDGKMSLLLWFFCARCHGRWERTALRQNTSERLDDSDTIDFQCAHLGATYLETSRGHPGFCHTILAIINQEGLADQDPGLLRFGRYLLMKMDHGLLLDLIPPKGTPQTAENLATFKEVDKTEYPAEWGAVEQEPGLDPAIDQWCEPQMMSEDDV